MPNFLTVATECSTQVQHALTSKELTWNIIQGSMVVIVILTILFGMYKMMMDM